MLGGVGDGDSGIGDGDGDDKSFKPHSHLLSLL